MEKGRGRLDADFLSPVGVPESVRRREENRRQRIATELEFMFPMPEPTQEELESGIKPQLRKLRRFLLVAIILAVGWAFMRVVSREKSMSADLGTFRNHGFNQTARDDRYRHFVFFPTPATMRQAQISCASHGGKLVRVNSEFDNIGVYSKCRASQCWLGLQEGESRGEWKWPDYVDAALGDFAPWKPEAGNGADGRQCAFVFGSGTTHHAYFRAQWKDANCEQLRPFVCDVSVGPPSWAAANMSLPGGPM